MVQKTKTKENAAHGLSTTDNTSYTSDFGNVHDRREMKPSVSEKKVQEWL